MISSIGGSGLVASLCSTLGTPWTVACQAPLSMRFPQQNYWSELPFPSPGDLSDPGIEPRSPALQEDSLPLARSIRAIKYLLLKHIYNFNFKGKSLLPRL